MITIECVHCEEMLRTRDVSLAIEFDRKHRGTRGPTPAAEGDA